MCRQNGPLFAHGAQLLCELAARVGDFVHRGLALVKEQGQNVAVRRRKALWARRRQFGGEPPMRALVRQRQKMSQIALHGPGV